MKLLTVSETAERLQLTRYRIHQFIKTGRLPAQKLGSQYVIKEADLKLVQDRKPGRPPVVKDRK